MKQVLRAYKKTVSIVNETAIGMYEGIAEGRKGFLLESYDKHNGRYTIFGVDPDKMITSEGMNRLVITNREGDREVIEGNPVEALKEYFDRFDVREEGDLAFGGGLVGSLAYDFIRYSEELPDSNPDEIQIENIYFMMATTFVVIDHVEETMTAVVLGEDTKEGKADSEERAADLISQLRSHQMNQKIAFAHDGKIVGKSDSMEEYCRKVEQIKNYIKEGHVFQTVLSQRWTIETHSSGFALYRELRELNPSPYLYYFNFGSFEIIGSSPEMLVKRKDNRVYTCPIAGTRKRGVTPEEDERLRQELIGDEKECAEHVMLVDLARNDMGRVAKIGTVKVTEFMKVQNYSHVMHITSLVEGKSEQNTHPLDLTVSFLPAGTLSGAPKIRAMEIIDELESVKRGLYGGATGYIDFNGNIDFCITIRTMIKKDNKVYLQAGAGIVADSVPEKEYEECCNKVMALAKTLVKEEQL